MDFMLALEQDLEIVPFACGVNNPCNGCSGTCKGCNSTCNGCTGNFLFG